MSHPRSLLAFLFIIALAPVAQAAEPAASPTHASHTFVIGGGETARTAAILEQLMGLDQFHPATTDPTSPSLAVNGPELTVSGTVADVSRVEAYLAMPEPRLPRLIIVETQEPSAVADRLYAEQAAVGNGFQWVAFPNDADGTLYLVANSQESLDAAEAHARKLSGLLARESLGIHDNSGEAESWTDRLHFGGSLSFGYTWYDGPYDSGSFMETRARVGVEYQGDNWTGAISAQKTVLEDF